MPREARVEGVNGVPKPLRLLHPLPTYVKCPACGAGLTFVEARGTRRLVLLRFHRLVQMRAHHYRIRVTKPCGDAVILRERTGGRVDRVR